MPAPGCILVPVLERCWVIPSTVGAVVPFPPHASRGSRGWLLQTSQSRCATRGPGGAPCGEHSACSLLRCPPAKPWGCRLAPLNPEALSSPASAHAVTCSLMSIVFTKFSCPEPHVVGGNLSEFDHSIRFCQFQVLILCSFTVLFWLIQYISISH